VTCSVASGVAVAVALWAFRPDSSVLVRMRLEPFVDAGVGTPPAAALALVASLGFVFVIRSVPTQIAALACGAVGAFAIHLRRQARARRDAAALRSETARVLRAWSADLRAGVPLDIGARASVESASDVWAALRIAEAPDIEEALRSIAVRRGADGLVDAAAACHLAQQTGAPLAATLDRVAEAIQADVDLEREVSVEAAPARATGRLMAMLPAVGIALGMLLGVNPLGVLVGTAAGVTCLVLGLGLSCLGVLWIERVVDGVDPSC